MVIQSNILPFITSWTSHHLNPLIVEPTVNVAELVVMLQRSQPDISCSSQPQRDPQEQGEPIEVQTCDPVSSLVPPGLAASETALCALVMQGQQLLGIITHSEVNQVSQLNPCLSEVMVCEIMRRPTALPPVPMSRFFKVMSIMQRFWRQWLPQPKHCMPLILDALQRQSSWSVAGQQLMTEITQATVKTAHLPAVLNRTVQQVHRLLNTDRVCIYQYQEDGSVWVQAEMVDSPYPQIPSGPFQDLWFSSPSAIAHFQAGQYLNLPKVEPFKPQFSQTGQWRDESVGEKKTVPLSDPGLSLWETLQIKSLLAIPICLDGGRVWGLLVAHHCAVQRVWKEPEIALLQSVALHLRTAIQYVTLSNTVEQLQHDLATQRHHYQTHLEKLETTHQLKDDFLSTVSHELKTPLSTIKMLTNLLQILWEKQSLLPQDLEKRVTQYLTMLEDECDREINLVNDLLMTQHLNTETYSSSFTRIDLHHWLSHLSEPFQQQTALHQQQFFLELRPPLPGIHSDLFALNRIVTELLNNACKYTPSGHSICLQAYTTQAPSQARSLRLVISNTGTEIGTEQLERIFEPFYQVPGQVCPSNGSGLGLALVKRLVEHLGGSLWVESAMQQVQFFVDLPLCLATPEVE